MLARYIVIVALLLLFLSCASSQPQEMSIEELKICKDIDLSLEPSFREMCAPRKMKFQGYKNIAMHRFLIQPKNAYLVQTGESVELRMPQTKPIDLGNELSTKIAFNKNSRKQPIKNRYFYKEKFIKKNVRVQLFKLVIPADDGAAIEYCFSISPKETNSERQLTRTTNTILKTTCCAFDSLSMK